MENWKKRLYASYISSGQVRVSNDRDPYYHQLIKHYLPSDTNISILDLACGHGGFIGTLKKHGYFNVIGVDISKEQVATAHSLGINEVVHEDLFVYLDNSKDAKYDVVILLDILEHLTKQEIFDLLDRVNDILTNDGTLLVHVPNGAGIFGTRVLYGDFTHQNAFTPKSIQQILHSCNYINVASFEDKPVVHGLKSLVRRILWQVVSLPFRLLLIAETGTTDHVLSQNMLVVAKKSHHK